MQAAFAGPVTPLTTWQQTLAFIQLSQQAPASSATQPVASHQATGSANNDDGPPTLSKEASRRHHAEQRGSVEFISARMNNNKDRDHSRSSTNNNNDHSLLGTDQQASELYNERQSSQGRPLLSQKQSTSWTTSTPPIPKTNLRNLLHDQHQSHRPAQDQSRQQNDPSFAREINRSTETTAEVVFASETRNEVSLSTSTRRLGSLSGWDPPAPGSSSPINYNGHPTAGYRQIQPSDYHPSNVQHYYPNSTDPRHPQYAAQGFSGHSQPRDVPSYVQPLLRHSAKYLLEMDDDDAPQYRSLAQFNSTPSPQVHAALSPYAAQKRGLSIPNQPSSSPYQFQGRHGPREAAKADEILGLEPLGSSSRDQNRLQYPVGLAARFQDSLPPAVPNPTARQRRPSPRQEMAAIRQREQASHPSIDTYIPPLTADYGPKMQYPPYPQPQVQQAIPYRHENPHSQMYDYYGHPIHPPPPTQHHPRPIYEYQFYPQHTQPYPGPAYDRYREQNHYTRTFGGDQHLNNGTSGIPPSWDHRRDSRQQQQYHQARTQVSRPADGYREEQRRRPTMEEVMRDQQDRMPRPAAGDVVQGRPCQVCNVKQARNEPSMLESGMCKRCMRGIRDGINGTPSRSRPQNKSTLTHGMQDGSSSSDNRRRGSLVDLISHSEDDGVGSRSESGTGTRAGSQPGKRKRGQAGRSSVESGVGGPREGIVQQRKHPLANATSAVDGDEAAKASSDSSNSDSEEGDEISQSKQSHLEKETGYKPRGTRTRPVPTEPSWIRKPGAPRPLPIKRGLLPGAPQKKRRKLVSAMRIRLISPTPEVPEDVSEDLRKRTIYEESNIRADSPWIKLNDLLGITPEEEREVETMTYKDEKTGWAVRRLPAYHNLDNNNKHLSVLDPLMEAVSMEIEGSSRSESPATRSQTGEVPMEISTAAGIGSLKVLRRYLKARPFDGRVQRIPKIIARKMYHLSSIPSIMLRHRLIRILLGVSSKTPGTFRLKGKKRSVMEKWLGSLAKKRKAEARVRGTDLEQDLTDDETVPLPRVHRLSLALAPRSSATPSASSVTAVANRQSMDKSVNGKASRLARAREALALKHALSKSNPQTEIPIATIDKTTFASGSGGRKAKLVAQALLSTRSTSLSGRSARPIVSSTPKLRTRNPSKVYVDESSESESGESTVHISSNSALAGTGTSLPNSKSMSMSNGKAPPNSTEAAMKGWATRRRLQAEAEAAAAAAAAAAALAAAMSNNKAKLNSSRRKAGGQPTQASPTGKLGAAVSVPRNGYEKGARKSVSREERARRARLGWERIRRGQNRGGKKRDDEQDDSDVEEDQEEMEVRQNEKADGAERYGQDQEDEAAVRGALGKATEETSEEDSSLVL